MPEGDFCTRCGAHRSPAAGSSGVDPHRLHRFTARPREHVLHPWVGTTLLPHVDVARLHVYRWGLAAAVALTAALAAAGLVVPAIDVAAVLVPAAYIATLREADHFSPARAEIIAATVVAGAVTGTVVTLVASHYAVGQGGGGQLLLITVSAVATQLLTPVIPVAMLRSRFTATIDGLVLGVAAGSGFAMAQTYVNLGGLAGAGPLPLDRAGWVITLLSVALLIPLLLGSCSGLVCAAVWRPHHGRARALRGVALPLAVIADIAFMAGSELLDSAAAPALLVLFWQALVVAAVLLAIRVTVHAATIEEAEVHGMRLLRCVHCGRQVEASAFCPHCGGSVGHPTSAAVDSAALASGGGAVAG